MFGEVYSIAGISTELYSKWENDMRWDVVAWERDGMMYIDIILTWIEAVKMKLEIERFNNETGLHLMLVKH